MLYKRGHNDWIEIDCQNGFSAFGKWSSFFRVRWQ